jgi:WD40 repeat protein
VAISPDGNLLATASDDGTAKLWDAVTGQGQHRFAARLGMMWAVAIAPNGRWLATGTSVGTVQIRGAITGRQRASLTRHSAYVSAVSAVAISPDGRWLATGSDDRTVRIWDPVTGVPQAMMRVERPVLACAWVGDRGLAAGGDTGLYLFDFLTGAAPPGLR